MFFRCFQDVCRIFSRMFSGCSDGSYWPGGIWWSFQMKVWTLKIQRNPMIPNYSMIPAAAIRWSPGIRWSPVIRWSPAIRWSIISMDFDSCKVYSDTSITDGLVKYERIKFQWKKWVIFHILTLFCQKTPRLAEVRGTPPLDRKIAEMGQKGLILASFLDKNNRF